MNIIAFRQQRIEKTKALRGLLDSATAAGRDLNVAEKAKYDSGLEELQYLNEQISDEEARLDAELSAPIEEHPNTAAARLAAAGYSHRSRRMKLGATLGPRKYADLFGTPRGDSGFSSFDEFMALVHSGRSDPRLVGVSENGVSRISAAASGMTEGIPSQGGFLVPEQFSAELLDAALESEIVRPRARVYPMTTSARKIGGWDAMDSSGGAPFGGFDIQWLGEGGSATTKKAKTRLLQLTANKAGLFTMASNELIEDGMTLEEMLGSALVHSVAWGLDYNFLQGDGAGKPLGLLHSPSLVVVSKEAGPQPADTIVYENVVKMMARMHPACFPNSVWVANSTCIPQLLTMSVKIKNVAGVENVGGSVVPVLTESNGQFRMLTRPVIFTEKLPVLGDKGDLILVDWSQYAIGLRREVSVEKSQHVGWQTDESGYRAIMRVDGQSRWSKPFTPKAGDTLSWAVCLETR